MKKVFTYLRELIDSDTNDDLKDFVALVMSFVLVSIVFYSMYIALTDSARLNIIIAVITFISALFGLKTIKETSKNGVDKK